MIKIEVTADVRKIEWTDKQSGERKSMLSQTAWAHCPGDKYPTKIEVIAPKGEAAYPEGVYVLAPESICVVTDERGRARLGIRPKLLTQSQAASRAPRAASAAG